MDRDDFEEEDDLERDDDQSPMTREQLEKDSSNSVQSLDRNKTGDENGLNSTLSSSDLK